MYKIMCDFNFNLTFEFRHDHSGEISFVEFSEFLFPDVAIDAEMYAFKRDEPDTSNSFKMTPDNSTDSQGSGERLRNVF